MVYRSLLTSVSAAEVYKKTGKARDEGVSIKRSSTPKEFKGRSSVGS